jgi:hypothetical protein
MMELAAAQGSGEELLLVSQRDGDDADGRGHGGIWDSAESPIVAFQELTTASMG